MAVLEVGVPHPIAELLEAGGRVTAGVGEMARVEAESDEIRICYVEESLGLVRSLDESGTVVMEDRPQARLITDRARNTLSAFREDAPLFGIQPIVWTDTTGEGCPSRISAVGIGEDDERPGDLCARRQQSCGAKGDGYTISCLICPQARAGPAHRPYPVRASTTHPSGPWDRLA